MQSILVISENIKSVNEYIDRFCEKEKINVLDKNINIFEKPLGIEDVRALHKKIILKPFKSKTKAIIVQAFDITLEAQNALLKTLEEPPNHTIIIIAVTRKDSILPTILSRCKIVTIQEKGEKSNEEISKHLELLKSIVSNGVGYRLKMAQDVSAKEEPLELIKNLIIAARTELLENYGEQNLLLALRSLQKTYTIIRNTNVNKRIALENLFLLL